MELVGYTATFTRKLPKHYIHGRSSSLTLIIQRLGERKNIEMSACYLRDPFHSWNLPGGKIEI